MGANESLNKQKKNGAPFFSALLDFSLPPLSAPGSLTMMPTEKIIETPSPLLRGLK